MSFSDSIIQLRCDSCETDQQVDLVNPVSSENGVSNSFRVGLPERWKVIYGVPLKFMGTPEPYRRDLLLCGPCVASRNIAQDARDAAKVAAHKKEGRA